MGLEKIISRFVLGNPNKEEKQALESWKSESKENLEGLKESMKIHEVSDSLLEYQLVDTQKAWTKVEQRLKIKTSIFNLPILMKVAAIFILLIASLYLFLPSDNQSTFIQTVHQTDTHKQINLIDGSVIELDAQSELTELGTRKVSIIGRAYFDISPDKNHPFKVVTNHGELEVLGTEFNIISSPTKSQIFVTEGRVAHLYLGKEYILNVGDMLELKENNIQLISNPVSQISAWKSKSLKFENERLKNVLESIANYFKIEIEFKNVINNDKCKINTTFNEETLEQVLKELELIAGIKYEFINNKIIIKSFKC
jgi:ferric-dicitrate binding protein FerR (iron transport regulator)